MTVEQREERRLAFYRAAGWIAKEQHGGKQFSELSSADGAAVVGEVYRRYPELKSAFDEPIGMDKVEPPSPSGAVDFSLRPATRSVAARYGFSAEDLAADPLKRSLVGHVARSEQLAGTVDAFDQALRTVGKAHGLNPEVYSERLKIGTIMARQHHPLAERS